MDLVREHFREHYPDVPEDQFNAELEQALPEIIERYGGLFVLT